MKRRRMMAFCSLGKPRKKTKSKYRKSFCCSSCPNRDRTMAHCNTLCVEAAASAKLVNVCAEDAFALKVSAQLVLDRVLDEKCFKGRPNFFH